MNIRKINDAVSTINEELPDGVRLELRIAQGMVGLRAHRRWTNAPCAIDLCPVPDELTFGVDSELLDVIGVKSSNESSLDRWDDSGCSTDDDDWDNSGCAWDSSLC